MTYNERHLSEGKMMSLCVSSEGDFGHDSLCLAHGRPPSWEPEMCICDVIKATRREALWVRVREVMPYANGYIEGREQAIRDCIAAVEAQGKAGRGQAMPGSDWVHTSSVLAAMRALLEAE